MTEGRKLTKRVVDAVKSDGSRFTLWDSELAGFGVRIEPTGRKTFVARYRAGGGRSGTLRQATVGRYGTVTVDEARRLARTLLGAAAGGGDPVGDRRRAQQAGLTVTEVCEWYLDEASSGRLLGRRGRPIKASTLSTDRNRIEAHVKPLLGKRPVQTLTVRDVEQMQADIAARKTAAKPVQAGKKRPRGGVPAGGAGTAGRTLGMLRTIFEHAARKGVVGVNPARGARKFADGRRTSRLSLDQIRTLGVAMKEAAAVGENATGLAAIRAILLTGFRREEALSIRRGWLLSGGGVDFPDTKSGPQVRPIGRAAIAELQRQAASATLGETDWLFPADRGAGHFVGIRKVLARVCVRAKLTGVTPHILRHSFASVAGDLGFSELTIAGLLGHAAGSVTAGYVHLDTALVTAADRVSAVIADALDGKQAAEVIALRSAG